ncbi:MAG: hypothetical protein E6G56_15465 [Actinobacteria bacterium]|nr:MAG: hypothetical protein E6G56_15465 [Actinomycetota bacterium]
MARGWIRISASLGMCAAAFAVCGASAPAAGADSPPNVGWPDLLPALGTAENPQPGPQPGCLSPSMACLDYEIARMREAQQGLGCDHRGVFATTYLVLTEVLRNTLAGDPAYFDDRDYLIYEDALFAHYYFRTLDAWKSGQAVPGAWRVAFQTAASGDANAAQDMLLGINAHVQRDMPYVMATLGLHRPDGSSRKADHDRVNQLLDDAYGPVVRAVAANYDDFVHTTNPDTPADHLAGLELVKTWRENVWRNAERLLDATTLEQRQAVEQSIESNAEQSARAIAAIQQPSGYRAQRDAYCAAHFRRTPATAGPLAPRPTKTSFKRAKHKPKHRRPRRRRRGHRHPGNRTRSKRRGLAHHGRGSSQSVGPARR